jgi:CHAT domain-containing protein
MPRSPRGSSRARWREGLLVLALGFGLLAASADLAAADEPAAAADLVEAEQLEREMDRLARSDARDRAIPLAERAVALREKRLAPSDPRLATSITDLGALYLNNGDLPRAEPLIRRAVAVLESAPDAPPRALGLALYHRSVLERQKGNNAKALEDAERAVKMLEPAGDEAASVLAMSLQSLASSRLGLGDRAAAIRHLERALAIRKQRSEIDRAVSILADLGHIEREFGRAYQAMQRYNEALELAEKGLAPDHSSRGKLLYLIGRALHRDRNYAEAERYYERASPILAATYGLTNPQMADFFASWSLLREAAGDVERAIELRAQSNEIEDSSLDVLMTSGTEDEKLRYTQKLRRHLEDTISLHAGIGARSSSALRLALTTILRRKARVQGALADDIAALRQHFGPDERRLLDDLARTRASLGTLLLRAEEADPSGYRAQVLALSADERRLEAEISAKSAALRAVTAKVTIEAVQAAIPEGAALLEFVRYQPYDARAYSEIGAKLGGPRYIVYVLTRTGEPRWTYVTANAHDVDTVVQQVRARIQEPTKPWVYDAADRLDHLLMRRVNELLGGAREILISPDGALNLLPFGALVEDGHFLIERWSFTYLTSGRDLLRLAAPRPSRSAPTIFANPTYDKADGPPAASAKDRGVKGAPPWKSRDREEPAPVVDPTTVSFPRLPGTEAEAKAILKVVPGAILRHGAEATEGALKAVSGPKFLHIATHGFFFGGLANTGAKVGTKQITSNDPLLRSGVALAGANLHPRSGEDGLLTAVEASALDLDGTEVVVLSACETGVGDVSSSGTGEGVRGLRRALVVAGAQTQVMSLWKVDDEATRELMTVYYDELFRKGARRSDALRDAQLALLRRKSTSHPFYWASFITSGASGKLMPDARWTTRPPAVAPGARGCNCEVFGARGEGAAGGSGSVAVLVLLVRRRKRSSR